MNNKKIIILLILSIFVIGMVLAPASASHTFKDKGYTYKMSTEKVNKLKKAAKKNTRSYTHVTVSKYVKTTSLEKVTKKKFLNAQKKGVTPYGKNYKFVSCKKSGSKYIVTLKKTAKMNCGVEYYNGTYHYYATAY